MIPYIIYNGFDSREFGALVSSKNKYIPAVRRFQKFTVPGRNGDLIIDEKTYDDVPIQYQLTFYGIKNPALVFESLRKSLSGCEYKRLEDSDFPGEYRLAAVSGAFSVKKKSKSCDCFKIDIKFVCKPQRYLNIGEMLVAPQGEIFNPTDNVAYPLIKFNTISDSGYISINDNVLSFSDATPETAITVDTESYNAYTDSGQNVNYLFAYPDELQVNPGANVVSNSGIGSLYIIPRWWIL